MNGRWWFGGRVSVVVAVLLIGMEAGLCFAAAETQRSVTLVDAESAHAILVVPDASEQEQFAARELADVLKLICGREFKIIHQREANQPVMAVGAGAARQILADLNLDRAELGDEGVVLRTHDQDLILTGAEHAPRGTIYAVYAFLEDVLGCRWWSPRDQTIPHLQTIRIEPLDVRYVPPLEQRWIGMFDAFDSRWALRNKINGYDSAIPSEMGGHVRYIGPYFVHTFGLLVPHAEYFKTHPEWFSEINGRRVAPPGATQLCLTNPSLLEFVKQKVRRIAQGVPKDTFAIISVSQDDNDVRCRCSRCLAVEKEEGSAAGPIIRFVNAIADDIRADHPAIAISTLAYDYSNEPTKITRPRDNVIILLCSDHNSYGQPMSAPVNAEFAEQLKGWTQISKRVYVWDYIANYHHYLLPHPNIENLAPNIRFLADHGVKGTFEEGNRHSLGGEFAVLRQWVLARKLWNPKLDDRQVLDEFLTGYYHEAAPAVKAYIQKLDGLAKGRFIQMTNPPLAAFLTTEFLADAYQLITKAENEAGADAEVARRLMPIRASILYGIVRDWSIRRQHSEMAGKSWPFREPYVYYAVQLDRACKSIGVTRLGSANAEGDLNTWFGELEAYPADAPQSLPEQLAKNRARRDWFVVQDQNIAIVGKDAAASSRVADASASDGWVIQLSPIATNMALYLPTSGLDFPPADPPGTWTMYLQARVERDQSRPAEGSAFSFRVDDYADGLHDVIEATPIPLDQTSPQEYRLYRMGTLQLNSVRRIWINASPNPAVKHVMVDRLIFVRGDAK